jgi:predicted phage terminase large subunit-like protein
LAADPTAKILYAAHTATFAATQSKRAKRLSVAAGVQLEPGSNRADEWQTTAGGGLVARGVGGEVTGRGFHLILVDDPIKSREVANSAVQREAVWGWLIADVLSRQESPSTAAIVVHTRWHADDPIGRLISERQWEGTTLRAIAEPGDTDGREPGEALWPEKWSAEALADIKIERGPYYWSSLYQGSPIPRGAEVFGEPARYTELPTEGYRVGYGVDLAYTAKTHADYSVCIRALAVGETLYIADVQRKQVDAPAFLLTLRAQHAGQTGPMRWHCSGTEKGAGQFIQQRLPSLQMMQATTDKFVRAQDVAAAWNAGKVLVPHEAPWLAAFLDEVQSFTGVGDAHDDQVDALASVHSLLGRPSAEQTKGLFQRWSTPRRI